MNPHTIDRIVGIDFAAPGKQLGHLAIVHSDNEHDGAVIPVPIAVISGLNGTAGPTILLTAGTHGDEYEGQVLLHELIRGIDPAQVHGRIIVLPSLNLPAVREGRRVSQVDGANLNRALPGNSAGGPTDQIAQIIEGLLLPYRTSHWTSTPEAQSTNTSPQPSSTPAPPRTNGPERWQLSRRSGSPTVWWSSPTSSPAQLVAPPTVWASR